MRQPKQLYRRRICSGLPVAHCIRVHQPNPGG
jgi:hypothetical protein